MGVLQNKTIGARIFEFLQRLGSSLMLPIAILPVAGLLLRLGAADLLNLPFMANAGGAIFSNLAVIFAIGVAVGWAKENHGSAALSAFIAFSVMNAAAPEIAQMLWQDSKGTDMAVLGGILSGLLAGMLYNRFYLIELPPYLAFFGGRRFVPIITGLAALVLAFLVAAIWPFFGKLFDSFGNWIVHSGSLGLFFYGFFNRLLIVTGLHHILNNLVWFQFGDFVNAAGEVVKGDLWRFFANDPSAGGFMSGFFPIMMFGLPAAALAMYHTSFPQNKKRAAGILFSAALTAFLTGVTEPLEFSFMFLAPMLYLIHAVLTGISLVTMHLLQVKLGFSFSAGLFDYVLNWGLATKPYMLLVIGPLYGVVYYFLFIVFIKWLNLASVGRESKAEASSGESTETLEQAKLYLEALGKEKNIIEITSCATRLRLTVEDSFLVDEKALQNLGARGILKPTANSIQVIVGTHAELLANQMKIVWQQAGGSSKKLKDLAAKKETNLLTNKEDKDKGQDLLSAFGKDNIVKIYSAAGSRLLVEVKDSQKVKQKDLSNYSPQQKEQTWMLTIGERAEFIAQVMNDLLV